MNKHIRNILINSCGETVMELLVATFILVMTLTVVIAVFMSGRAGVVDSWERTEQYECAVYLIEQVKATPYATLLEWEKQINSGGAALPKATIALENDGPCSSIADLQFDLVSYQTFPKTEMLQINVRVRKNSSDNWIEKGSLVRKEKNYGE